MVWGKIKLMICYSKSKDEWADDAHSGGFCPFALKEAWGMGFNPFEEIGKAAAGAGAFL